MTAIDIGGTWTRIGGPAPQTFATEQDYRRQLGRIREVVHTPPNAIGVAFCGRVTAEGAVRVSLNLRGYEGESLAADLAAMFGCPVRVAHDATCGLLGEHRHGALQGIDRCGYVTLSTGVGSAISIGGIVLTTEAGHQQVHGNDRECVCGRTGCLETLLGGGAAKRRGQPLEDIHDSHFWRVYARTLADGLENFALSAGLDVIAVGGAIARREDLWPLGSGIVRAALDDAPLRGAAVLLDTPPHAVLH